MNASTAFDALAEDYDRAFTDTPLGTRMRQAVWRRLAARFGPGDRVLEINCGTGVDAVHLAGAGIEVTATDGSSGMLAVARRRVEAAGVADRVRLAQVRLEALDGSLGEFDGALSNFGGVNCVADVGALAARLAGCLRPGAVAILAVMGPLVPWEWVWFTAQGQPRRALRRLARSGAVWRGATIRYPSIRQLRRRCAPWFVVDRVAGVGCLLPPPFANRLAAAYPRLVDWLDRTERRRETTWPVPHLADHYVAELIRTDQV